MPVHDEVPAEVRALAERLAEPKPMRRGSVSERYVKCSKPGCACARGSVGRHGPYYSLTKAVKGRTCSRLLAAAEADIARRQIEAGRHFREQTEAYWRASEAWADRELGEAEAASPEAAKKGASKRPSRRRSPPKSQR